MPLTDAEIVERYRSIYGLDDSIGIQHARAHWDLERNLTSRLLASTPNNRWEVFSAAYSELYSGLPWLNQKPLEDRSSTLGQWHKLTSPNSKIFEVGSGKAELLKHLSALGHDCTATEITPERGKRHAEEDKQLKWHITDGIHLADFEPADAYDVVISTGVIEHFHPEDIVLHFQHARRILKKGGRYIFTTPHIASGPHDLSRVFGKDRAVCMHLREYDYRSLVSILHEAGYVKVAAVFPPSRLYRLINWTTESRLFLGWLSCLDWVEAQLGLSSEARRRLRKYMRAVLMPDNIWLSATK